MSIRSVPAVMFLMFVSACTTPTPPPAESAATVPDTTTSAILPSDTVVMNTPLETAVRLANAIKANPTRRDSILAASGMIEKTWLEMLNRVTQDQKMNVEFRRRTQ